MAIKLITALSNVKIQTGHLTTPDGTEYDGFKVTIGDVLDPSTVSRTYDDIEAILGKNKISYVTHEEKRANGKFLSYSISTSGGGL